MKLAPQATPGAPRSIDEQIALIRDVSIAYTTNNRGVADIHAKYGTCVYDTHATGSTRPPEQPRRCAFGRALNEAGIREFGAVSGSVTAVRDNILARVDLDDQTRIRTLDDILRPEYKGFPVSLWMDLQRLHDNFDCWTDVGLSAIGANQVNLMHRLANVGWYTNNPDIDY